jgi:hypothetical protein
VTRGPYDPTRHLVTSSEDFLQRLGALHPSAAVAWDRDVAGTIDDRIIIAASSDLGAIALGILGYAVDLGGRIFRLVRVEDDRAVEWRPWDRDDRTLQIQHDGKRKVTEP